MVQLCIQGQGPEPLQMPAGARAIAMATARASAMANARNAFSF